MTRGENLWFADGMISVPLIRSGSRQHLGVFGSVSGLGRINYLCGLDHCGSFSLSSFFLLSCLLYFICYSFLSLLLFLFGMDLWMASFAALEKTIVAGPCGVVGWWCVYAR